MSDQPWDGLRDALGDAGYGSPNGHALSEGSIAVHFSEAQAARVASLLRLGLGVAPPELNDEEPPLRDSHKPHSVQLRVDHTGKGSLVIDGNDVSNCVRSIVLRTEPNRLSEMDVTFHVFDLDFDGMAEVQGFLSTKTWRNSMDGQPGRPQRGDNRP